MATFPFLSLTSSLLTFPSSTFSSLGCWSQDPLGTFSYSCLSFECQIPSGIQPRPSNPRSSAHSRCSSPVLVSRPMTATPSPHLTFSPARQKDKPADRTPTHGHPKTSKMSSGQKTEGKVLVQCRGTPVLWYLVTLHIPTQAKA